MRSTAKIVSVRILKPESPFVQVTVCYSDDPTRYYLTDGQRYETALVRMSDYQMSPDSYSVGRDVYYWFSSTVDRGSSKVRYYICIEPIA